MSEESDTEGTEAVCHFPQKKFYRQRAHANPMSDHDLVYPVSPSRMDWTPFFEISNSKQRVEFVDVGCGYGGLLVELSPRFPDTLILGLEIRVKVSDFVVDRIKALRSTNPGKYSNIACLRANAMKNLPNFFFRHQLSKLFFLFPDPHFKKVRHKRRIISRELLDIYAFVLKPQGLIYTATDVEDLHLWMLAHINNHPLFVQLSEEEMNLDPVVQLLPDTTEEGKKVSRNKGAKWFAVFRRLPDPEWI